MKYRRRLKYYLIKVFRLHDSPKDVAGGLAWGTFVNFYPTFGFGALLAVFMARFSRSNYVAATVGWAISAPLFPLFFYFNILSGEFVLGHERGLRLSAAAIRCLRFRDVIFLGKAFTLGTVINSSLSAIAMWWLGYIALKKYRKRALNFIKRSL